MSAAQSRNQRIDKLFKVTRKLYTQVVPPANRTLMEHLVFACCLEDSAYEAAEEVFSKLQSHYFDWNEVRVTTTSELSELMKGLFEPEAAATRVRKSLQGLFEAHYTFDIDSLKKENLGKAQDQIVKYRGVSPFGLAYVTQHSLGGHSIPLDRAMLNLLHIVGIISDEEKEQGKATGLERAIPKNKGIEFASVTHQLATAFLASPQNPNLRKILLQIDSTAAERFPKRGSSKTKDAAPSQENKPKKGKAARAAAGKAPTKPTAKPAVPAKKSTSGDRAAKGPARRGKVKAAGKNRPKSSLSRLSKRKPR